MSAVEYTWRDAELRSRPLRAFNWVGGRLDHVGLEVPSLSPTSVMKAAPRLQARTTSAPTRFVSPSTCSSARARTRPT